MRRQFVVCVLAMFAIAAAAVQVPVTVLSGVATCRECSIQPFVVATLTDGAFPGAVDMRTAVFVTAQRQFLLAPFMLRTPHLADESGRVVRQLGREGSGPNEYRRAVGFLEHDRGFLVFDGQLRRVTQLSRDFQYQDVAQVPPVNFFSLPVAFPDGSYLMNGMAMTRDTVMTALHLVSPDGKLLRSFSAAVPGEEQALRIVTRSRNGSLLVARRDSYRIERWTKDGVLLLTYERKVDWFPPGSRGAHRVPQLLDLDEDQAGLLWVRISWFNPPTGQVPRWPTGRTVIEVLDLERGHVLATRELPLLLGDVGGGAYGREYAETPAGEPVLRIWGFRLLRPR